MWCVLKLGGPSISESRAEIFRLAEKFHIVKNMRPYWWDIYIVGSVFVVHMCWWGIDFGHSCLDPLSPISGS